MYKFLLLICILVLSGCVSPPAKGPIYSGPVQAKDGMATIYFYRPARFVGSLRSVNIFINSEAKYGLSNGTYTVAYLSPGIYRFGAKYIPHPGLLDSPLVETKFELVDGESYFIGYFQGTDLKGLPAETYFYRSSRMEADTGYLEGGVFDIEHEIGVVHEKFAINDIKKLGLSTVVVDPKKI